MDATIPSPDDLGIEGLHNFIAEKSEALCQVQNVCNNLNIIMSKDDSDKRTRTLGSDAPLLKPE